MEERVRKIVSAAYAKHGFALEESTCKVNAGLDGVEIFFNSEKPFVGEAFFEIIEEIKKEIVSETDFEFCEGKYFYDFYMVRFA